MVYINGSFVTAKKIPGDYDLCWSIDGVIPEKLNPIKEIINALGLDVKENIFLSKAAS